MISAVWHRLIAQREAKISLALLVLLIALSVLAPLIAPQNPTDPLDFDPAMANHPPELSWSYVLGTDSRGRSVLALLLWGGRLTLLIGLGSGFVATAFGLLLGTLAATCPAFFTSLIGRLMDLVQAIPPLLLALVLVAKLGVLDVPLLILIFSATGWAPPARIAHVAVAVALRSTCVEAARAVGVTGRQLLLRHLLPEALAGVAVWAAGAAVLYVTLETGLDFLGLGLGANTMSWGTALVGAQDALASGNWWWLLFGGLGPAITALVLGTLAFTLGRAVDPLVPLAGSEHTTARAAIRLAVMVPAEDLPLALIPAIHEQGGPGVQPPPWNNVSLVSSADIASEYAHKMRRQWVLPILLVVLLVLGAFGVLRQQTASQLPDAVALVELAAGYPARAAAPSYIATARYDADTRLLRDRQIPWAALQDCPPDFHALTCAHAETQLWFSTGQGRALTEGGVFVCGPNHTWGVNPMAGIASATSKRCTALGPDPIGLGFTAGNVSALLPSLLTHQVHVIGQEVLAGRRCWDVALSLLGRACLDAHTGLVVQLERLDHVGMPVARFTLTAVEYNLTLAQELFANPIPGGTGPLIDGLSQPLLTIQAADDQALFTSLVPTYTPPDVTALTPTFDSFYNSDHGYALEQRVRQSYRDRSGKVVLVLIETLPGSGWDDTPRVGSRVVTLSGVHLQVWSASAHNPAEVRVESIGTAALVTSSTFPLDVLERVAAGLQ